MRPHPQAVAAVLRCIKEFGGCFVPAANSNIGDETLKFGNRFTGVRLQYSRQATMREYHRQCELLEGHGVRFSDEQRNPDPLQWAILYATPVKRPAGGGA